MRLAEESLRAIDLEAVSQQVSAEMEQAMAQLRIKLESVDWDHLGRRTQRAMERAVERMQRDIERLAGKAARSQAKLERMAQRAAQKQEKLGRMAGGLVEPTGPEPNLEEERLAILKMNSSRSRMMPS